MAKSFQNHETGTRPTQQEPARIVCHVCTARRSSLQSADVTVMLTHATAGFSHGQRICGRPKVCQLISPLAGVKPTACTDCSLQVPQAGLLVPCRAPFPLSCSLFLVLLFVPNRFLFLVVFLSSSSCSSVPGRAPSVLRLAPLFLTFFFEAAFFEATFLFFEAACDRPSKQLFFDAGVIFEAASFH